jgi:cytochrome b561
VTLPRFRNGGQSFGLVTRVIHWGMALGVIGALALGSYIARMKVDLSNVWLFGLHKSVGLTLFALLALRLLWHVLSPPPAPIATETAWHGALARLTHRALYLLLAAVPLTGWIASAASGLDVVLYGRWTLPRIAPVSEAWQDAFFAAHGVLTKALIFLLLLHVAGAVRRRDGTLRRMLRGGSAGSAR